MEVKLIKVLYDFNNMSKICSECGILKSLNEYQIDRKVITKIGYVSKCKECIKEYNRRRAKIFPDFSIKQKVCSICKVEKTIDNYIRSYRHRDGWNSKCKECVYSKKKKGLTDYSNYWKDKRKNNKNYSVRCNIRRWMNMCFKKERPTCKYIGCSIEFFQMWIEYNFNENMNWDNYGKVWHLDHLIPVSSYDLSVKENQFKCFSWKNYQPLLALENIKKSNTIIEEQIELQQERINEFLELYEIFEVCLVTR